MNQKNCAEIKKRVEELYALREQFFSVYHDLGAGEKVRSGKMKEQEIRKKMEELESMMIVEYLGYKMHEYERKALKSIVEKRIEIIKFNSFGMTGSDEEVRSRVEKELSSRIKSQYGKVISLDLNNWSLGGLPKEIPGLKYLRLAALNGNLFSGQQEFWDLLKEFSSLEFLDLRDNPVARSNSQELHYWKKRLGENFLY